MVRVHRPITRSHRTTTELQVQKAQRIGMLTRLMRELEASPQSESEHAKRLKAEIEDLQADLQAGATDFSDIATPSEPSSLS